MAGLEYGCFIFIYFYIHKWKRNVHIIIHKSNRHTVLCRPTHGIPQPCSCCWSWVVVLVVVVVVVVRLGGTLFGLWANCSLWPSHPGNLVRSFHSGDVAVFFTGSNCNCSLILSFERRISQGFSCNFGQKHQLRISAVTKTFASPSQQVWFWVWEVAQNMGNNSWNTRQISKTDWLQIWSGYIWV